MKVIEIKIENKRAHSPTEKIVCGNSDYVLEFDFDEEWHEYEEKTAFFVCNNGITLQPVIFQGKQCPVPVISNTTMVGVGVSAGNLHTTTKALIACEKSIRCGLDEPQEPTPDVYAQLMQMINDGKINGGSGSSIHYFRASPFGDPPVINQYSSFSTDINNFACLPKVNDLVITQNLVLLQIISVSDTYVTCKALNVLKGDPFTYEDFTPEQLAELKSEIGGSGTNVIVNGEVVKEFNADTKADKIEIEAIKQDLYDVEEGYGSANIFDNDFSQSGYYSQGVHKTSANFKCTPVPVPINKVVDTLYAIITDSANPLAMHFLDENGLYLSDVALSKQTAIKITIPSGATSFVMYAPTAWTGKVCISYEQLSEYVDYGGYSYTYVPKKLNSDKTLSIEGGFADAKIVGEKLEQVYEDLRAIPNVTTEKSRGNLFNGEWVDGWFSTADGTDNPNIKNWVVTSFIPFEMSGDYSNSLNVKTSVASTRLTYAIYDENKVFIKADYVTVAEFSICDLVQKGYVRFMRPNTEEFDLYVSQEPFVSYERIIEKKVSRENLSTELQSTIQAADDIILEKRNGNIFDNEYGSLGSISAGVDTFNKNNNNFKRTAKYYPFKKGVLYFRAQSNINPLSVDLFDSDKKYVETLPLGNVTAKDIFLEYDGYFRLYVPLANETLIYISNDKPSDEVDYEYHGTAPYIEQKTEYANDICVCFGDSIMAGDYERPWTSIPYLLGQKAGMKTYNIGFGGTRMADRGISPNGVQEAWSNFSFYALVDAIVSGDFTKQDNALKVDLPVGSTFLPYFSNHLETLKMIDFNKVTRITIAYGTNDYTGMNDISSDNDLDVSTVCGALKYSIKKLEEAFPHLKILVITPIWGYYDIERGKSGDNIDYGKGALPAYVEAIQNTCKELKIPCLDAYYQLGFNFYNCEYYFNGGADNVHLNEKGRERYAELIYGKQKSIY